MLSSTISPISPRDADILEAAMAILRRRHSNGAYEDIGHMITGYRPSADFAVAIWPQIYLRLQQDRRLGGQYGRTPRLWDLAYIVCTQCGTLPASITDQYLDLLNEGHEGHRITANSVRNMLERRSEQSATR